MKARYPVELDPDAPLPPTMLDRWGWLLFVLPPAFAVALMALALFSGAGAE